MCDLEHRHLKQHGLVTSPLCGEARADVQISLGQPKRKLDRLHRSRWAWQTLISSLEGLARGPRLARTLGSANMATAITVEDIAPRSRIVLVSIVFPSQLWFRELNGLHMGDVSPDQKGLSSA